MDKNLLDVNSNTVLGPRCCYVFAKTMFGKRRKANWYDDIHWNTERGGRICYRYYRQSDEDKFVIYHNLICFIYILYIVVFILIISLYYLNRYFMVAPTIQRVRLQKWLREWIGEWQMNVQVNVSSIEYSVFYIHVFLKFFWKCDLIGEKYGHYNLQVYDLITEIHKII